jgi:preprotein translocase subunit SecG
MYTILITIQISSALLIVILILLQQGKGANMGAAFGSGTSGSLFGSSGGANFFSRITAVLATSFFISTLSLSFLSDSVRPSSSSVLQSQENTSTAIEIQESNSTEDTPIETETPAIPEGK